MLVFLSLSFTWISITSLYFGIKISRELKKLYNKEKEENYLRLRKRYSFFLIVIFIFFILRSIFAFGSIFLLSSNTVLPVYFNLLYFLLLEVLMILFFVVLFRKNNNNQIRVSRSPNEERNDIYSSSQEHAKLLENF